MKVLKIFEKTKIELGKSRYSFFCLLFFFIPIRMICDWNDSIPNKKDGDEGFMFREYYFLGAMIWKRKHKTKCWIPNSRN